MSAPNRGPSSPRDGAAAYSIGPLLRLAGHRATTAFSAALAPLGIEGRHFGVMLHIAARGPLSQSRLQELTGTDKSTMVRTVDQLEARGLARRQAAAGDRRAYAVELTPAGAATFVEAEQVARRVADELLDCLKPDERSQFRDLLRRFAAGG